MDPCVDSHSARLPPGQQLAAAHKWPVVGERLPLDMTIPWLLSAHGLVQRPRQWSVEELKRLEVVERIVDIHCVTRWSKLDMPFQGIRLAELVSLVEPLPEARFVSLVSRSPRAHSTSLPLALALELETLVCWQALGEPLAIEHGGPLRIVVPGRYFYKSLKWVEQIEFLAQDRLGYWEATAGYHNEADPWREQRYMAPRLSRQEMAKILATRDWSGADLLGLDAHARNLSGLDATRALLRDVDFRECNLRGARFDHANLSNARLQQADLRDASFVGADLEGANLAGADLRGANLSGASFFGASFQDQGSSGALEAVLDKTTQIDASVSEALTPEQAAFVRRWFESSAGPQPS